jgi:hypothetical protein
VGVNAGLNNDSAFGVSNTFVGHSAGQANTTGQSNSFFGHGAGKSAQTGNENSYFGADAGINNVDGFGNSFFGYESGRGNLGSLNTFVGAHTSSALSFVVSNTGSGNSFFGAHAGQFNETGEKNTFVGRAAGDANRSGSFNTFLGSDAGSSNKEGSRNTFVGESAGASNQGGSLNTLLGSDADLGSAELTNATAIGADAQVTQSDSLVLGSISGINGATADTKIGIGTTAPTHAFDVHGPVRLRGAKNNHTNLLIQTAGGFGDDVSLDFVKRDNTTVSASIVFNGFTDQTAHRADIRLYTRSSTDTTDAVGRVVISDTGNLQPFSDNAYSLGINTARWKDVWAVNGTIQTSDARLKRDVRGLGVGLAEVMRLRPVSFRWREGTDTATHLGLLAQEVEQVVPEVVRRGDAAGGPLGVSYTELTPVLVKAVQQQQGQITAQQQTIEELRRQNARFEARLAALERLASARGASARGASERQRVARRRPLSRR